MSEIIDRLWHGLIPAVPVPFLDGEIDVESQERYAAWMSTQPIAGVACWAHTGRGLYLSESQREQVLASWRAALPQKVIVAGAGGSPKSDSDRAYLESAISMAEHAKGQGADALLCYAPVRFRSSEDQDEKIPEYHQSLASVGLPLILFYLYEAAGGISYSQSVLTRLLAIPEVIGIKIATLDSVMTYQDVSALCKSMAPDKLVITGEDRFLGYSLMCGADAALIGMGAAFTQLQHDLLQSFYSKDHTRFQQLSDFVDRLAQSTFIQPMEGYIARMSFILARQGIFEPNAWIDPWGPPILDRELLDIEHTIDYLTAQL